MFLEPTLKNKSTTSNLGNDSQVEEDVTECDDLQLARAGPSTSAEDVVVRGSTNKRLKINPVDRQFIDILNKSVAAKEKPAEMRMMIKSFVCPCTRSYVKFQNMGGSAQKYNY